MIRLSISTLLAIAISRCRQTCLMECDCCFPSLKVIVFLRREKLCRGYQTSDAPSAKAHSTETWSRLREQLLAGHYVWVWTGALADVAIHHNKPPMLQSEAPAGRTLLIFFDLFGWRQHTRSCKTTSLVWLVLICVFLGHERLHCFTLLPWLSTCQFCSCTRQACPKWTKRS
jgi:hypothetical protein